MKIRFLLDENRSKQFIPALLRRDPAVDVIRIGDAGALPLGTLDPDMLLYCESQQRMLVTNNRKSMPGHIADHLSAGHHHWGILQLTHELSIGEHSEQLYMFWEASEAEEWIDRFEYLPY